MSKYYKLTLPIQGEEEQENAIAILNFSSNFESVEQLEDKLLVSYKSENQSKSDLEEMLKELNLCTEWSLEDEPEINWNETFEKSFQPIIIGDNAWGVRASFHEKLPTQHEIIINPKMSFGTGHHETTKQMMEFIAVEDFRDAVVWDYGSGTGILAIMADMLGAKEVKANDNEDWAYANSLENAAMNSCATVQFHLGTIEECEANGFLEPSKDVFDIIIANITKNILLDSAFKIDAYSKPNTRLFLSGFYQKDIEDIEKKYNSLNFYIQSQSQLNDWACLKLVKK